jgi:cobalt-zinc-cadmium efflux system outer membrane protein
LRGFRSSRDPAFSAWLRAHAERAGPWQRTEVVVKRSSLSGLALLVASLSTPLRIAAADSEVVLRWPEVAAAVDQHPLVLEAQARMSGASGVVSTARAFPNPVVGITGGDAFARVGPEHRREWGYSVELPLEFLNARRQRVAAAMASAEGAQQEARGVRAEVLRELRRSFVALAHGQSVLEAKTELEGQVARLAALVRRRSDWGEGRPTEVLRVEIELERLRASVERARATAEARRQRLVSWLGNPVVRVEADLSRTFPLPPWEELRQRVIASSPVVRARRDRVDAATAESSAERWERLPKVSVGGSRVEELDRRATTLAATVTVPLWNWNAGRIRQADAALAGERARLDATIRELSARLSDTWQGCSAGQSAAARYRDEILPRAEASARTLGRAFELGESGLLDVIDARRILLDTRSEYLDLLLEMQTACGDLAALAELELP